MRRRGPEAFVPHAMGQARRYRLGGAVDGGSAEAGGLGVFAAQPAGAATPIVGGGIADLYGALSPSRQASDGVAPFGETVVSDAWRDQAIGADRSNDSGSSLWRGSFGVGNDAAALANYFGTPMLDAFAGADQGSSDTIGASSDSMSDGNVAFDSNDELAQANVPGAANDNRDPICIDAAHDCISNTISSDTHRMCYRAEQVCNILVGHSRSMPPNYITWAPFPDGTRVVIRGGGQVPYILRRR